MSLCKPLKEISASLMILAVLALALPPMTSSSTLAQGKPAYVRRVRSLETRELGAPNPAGLAFSPRANAFHLVQARTPTLPPPPDTDVLSITPFEEQVGSARIAAAIRDPINMAFDAQTNRLLILNSDANRLIEVREGPDGNLDPTTLVRHDARHFGLQNPQGMAVDPASGHLFILDGAGPRIVRIAPDPGGGFDGALVSEIDLGQTGLADVRGLAFDPGNGHFYLLGTSEQELYEVSETGQVVTTRDLSGFGLVEPQGLVYAPSGDLTDDPSQMSLYIADSGLLTQQAEGAASESSQPVDAGMEAPQTPGNITEFSFSEIPAPAAAAFVAELVQTIDTSAFVPPSPDTAGIAYLEASDTLLFSDSEVNEMPIFTGDNLFEMTTGGALLNTTTTTSFSDEPTGVGHDPSSGLLFISDDTGDRSVYVVDPGGDSLYGTADDVVTSFSTSDFGSNDPEGVTYDTWQDVLFIVDGVNSEVYRVSPGPNGWFDGAPGTVTSFDTLSHGIEDPEGITFNSYNGNIFVVGKPADTLAEFTTAGSLVQTIDISAANADKPAGLAYAPGSLAPETRNIYIAERGVDNDSDPNENDGKVYELTLQPMVDVPPMAHDDAASTVRNTPVTIDVAANDTDLNGNLDPASTNTGCATCSSPANGTLVNHGDGTFTYTPDLGFLGSDGFVYEICDTEALCDTATVSISVTGPTVEVRVAASSDDAEEDAAGQVGLTSSDLELVLDSDNQTVGMRFNALTIPPGATISNAYIQFQVDETHSDPTALTIQGQAHDNGPTFVGTNHNISGRARTTAAVSWAPAPWTSAGEAGPDQQTPDITPVIQEIVDRPGWASGNSLVIIITGTGKRVAEAYDGDQAGAPLLHVEYDTGSPMEVQVGAGSDDAEERARDQWVRVDSDDLDIGDSNYSHHGVRFQNVTIPQGATILEAYVTFTADEVQTGTSDLAFRGEASDNAGAFASATGNLSGRPTTADLVYWNHVPAWNTIGGKHQSPDLSPIIQEIVDRPGWVQGNALVLLITGTGKRAAESFEGEPDPVQLRVVYDYTAPTCYSLTTNANPAASGVVSADPPPNCGADRYREGTAVQVRALPNAGYQFDSWGDDLGGSANPDTVTMEAARMVTANFSVSNVGPVAYDAHTVDDDNVGNSSGDGDGTVDCGETVELGLSLRNDGTEAATAVNAVLSAGADPHVTWQNDSGTYGDIPGSGAAWTDPPYLFSVDPGTPNGHVLHLDIDASATNGGPWVDALDLAVACEVNVLDLAVSQSSDDAEERSADGFTRIDSGDLDMGDNNYYTYSGLRFQNVTIPQGANILEAYVTFTADEVRTGTSDLAFLGEASDNAGTFVSTVNNLSGRTPTGASVDWNHVPVWTTIGQKHQSPDLSPIVQEIVNRSGWSPGNALVLLITGSGKRAAESWEGDQAGAPLLHVEFQ